MLTMSCLKGAKKKMAGSVSNNLPERKKDFPSFFFSHFPRFVYKHFSFMIHFTWLFFSLARCICVVPYVQVLLSPVSLANIDFSCYVAEKNFLRYSADSEKILIEADAVIAGFLLLCSISCE